MERFVTRRILHVNEKSACRIKLCEDEISGAEIVMKVYNLETLKRKKKYVNVDGRLAASTLLDGARSELDILLKLRHRSCVHLVCHSEEGGRLKLGFPHYESMHIMEPTGCLSYDPRIPGLSSPEVITSLIEDIQSAIAYVHSLNIIHRDIKPDNILHGSRTGFVLSDFGSARSVLVDGMTGESPATLAFYSPEACSGTYNGFKADWFALGMTVWCCIFQRLPYIIENKGDMLELIDKISSWNVHDSSDHLSNVPNNIRGFLHGLLERDPQARYAG